MLTALSNTGWTFPGIIKPQYQLRPTLQVCMRTIADTLEATAWLGSCTCFCSWDRSAPLQGLLQSKQLIRVFNLTFEGADYSLPFLPPPPFSGCPNCTKSVSTRTCGSQSSRHLVYENLAVPLADVLRGEIPDLCLCGCFEGNIGFTPCWLTLISHTTPAPLCLEAHPGDLIRWEERKTEEYINIYHALMTDKNMHVASRVP